MAHVAKVKSAGVAPMVGHYAREAERRGFERDNIDGSRTRLNYAISGSGSGREFLAVPNPDDLAARVRGRISEAVESHEKVSGKALRKDANVMFDWVVTLPKDCPEDRARDFFTAAVGFIQGRYGAENVPGGFVHMDEATPHVHVPVVPVKGGKLVGAKVVNRTDLKTFHKDLSAAVDASLGFHVSIELDEAQKGAKQLSALSQDEYKVAKDELAAAKDAAAAARAEADEAQRRLESVQQAERAAESEVAELERQVDQAELEPAPETVGQSVGNIFQSRGLGEREAGLASEVESLRNRVEAAEAERAELGRKVPELEHRMRGLERSREGLVERIGELVSEWRERGGDFIAGVGERVVGVLKRFGVRAFDGPPPLSVMLEQAVASSRAWNQEHSAPTRHNSRGIGL